MDHTQPEVHWTWRPSHFSLLPANLPHTVPPPLTEASLRAPFGINKSLYNFVLRPEIPFLFAAIYTITIFYLNAYNRRRRNEPWNISKRREFGYFVVAHNVFLAIYSFATFIAMGRAAGKALPAWDAENWSVRAADGLCKLHGPRGLGDAATFNTTINIWEVKNTAIKLTGMGMPDPTDVGRLWNEGLAFWGWMFYVSKFYEVVDTFIILAKGKRSATLQTYHHAGAMLCMWAGIRYMSPPIWMFVFVNSGIHALMYTYFTASALGMKVPTDLKRTLTILQITQFVWGASYAAAHLFIQYDIPIATPFQVVHAVQRAASSVRSTASSASSVVSSIAESPIATATLASFLKKMLLRAAGEEGVAERLAMQDPLLQGAQQVLPGVSIPTGHLNVPEKVRDFIEHRYETRYQSSLSRINCIDTTGEAFAIYLNLLYLSPLTWLFIRFFIRAYTQRVDREGRARKARSASEALHDAALSVRDAEKDTKASFEEGGKKVEDEVDKKGSQAEEEVKKDVQKVIEELRSGGGLKAGDRIQQAEDKVKNAVDTATNKMGEVRQQISEASDESVVDTVKSKAQELKKQVSAKQDSSSGTAQAEEESASSTSPSKQQSFKERAQAERQSSSTWIRGGAGLFRRTGTDDATTATTKTNAHGRSASQSENQDKGEDGNGDGGDAAESTEKQDDNLEESQPTRPDPEEDSDAMGRSGAIVEKEDGDGDEGEEEQ